MLVSLSLPFAVAFFGYILNTATAIMSGSGPAAKHAAAVRGKLEVRGVGGWASDSPGVLHKAVPLANQPTSCLLSLDPFDFMQGSCRARRLSLPHAGSGRPPRTSRGWSPSSSLFQVACLQMTV